MHLKLVRFYVRRQRVEAALAHAFRVEQKLLLLSSRACSWHDSLVSMLDEPAAAAAASASAVHTRLAYLFTLTHQLLAGFRAAANITDLADMLHKLDTAMCAFRARFAATQLAVSAERALWDEVRAQFYLACGLFLSLVCGDEHEQLAADACLAHSALVSSPVHVDKVCKSALQRNESNETASFVAELMRVGVRDSASRYSIVANWLAHKHNLVVCGPVRAKSSSEDAHLAHAIRQALVEHMQQRHEHRNGQLAFVDTDLKSVAFSMANLSAVIDRATLDFADKCKPFQLNDKLNVFMFLLINNNKNRLFGQRVDQLGLFGMALPDQSERAVRRRRRRRRQRHHEGKHVYRTRLTTLALLYVRHFVYVLGL